MKNSKTSIQAIGDRIYLVDVLGCFHGENKNF